MAVLTSGRGPLNSLRILDFTIMMSGPLCTRWMADAGADVLKIEAPEGDVVRKRPPFRGEMSAHFAAMNCGKRSVTLDLRTPEGREAARALALSADVLVENFRPGVMERLELGYSSLSQHNPGLIYCSISGFGQAGPLADVPAYAPVIHAASGYEWANMQYQQDKARPANSGIFMADVLGGINALAAIQLALLDREHTKEGQLIDVSLMDSMLGLMVYELQAAQMSNERQRPVYEPVRTRDGHVMVAAVTPKNIAALLKLIGCRDAQAIAKFENLESRELHWREFLNAIEVWTIERTSESCEAELSAAGVPCSRYLTVAEAMKHPQVLARQVLAGVPAEGGPLLVAGLPFRMSSSHVAIRPSVPKLGEHTAQVLQGLAEGNPWMSRAEASADPLPVGAQLTERSLSVEKSMLRDFRIGMGHEDADPPDAQSLSPILLCYEPAHFHEMAIARKGRGARAVSVRAELKSFLQPGQRLKLRARVTDRWLKRGNEMIEVQMQAETEDGKEVCRYTYVEAWTLTAPYSATLPVREPSSPPISAALAEPAQYSSERHFSAAMISAFSHSERNIHNDLAFAQQSGFPRTVLVGVQMLSFMMELACEVLGADFARSGGLSIKFIKPVLADTTLRLRATLEDSGEGSLGALQMTCSDDSGHVVSVGNAWRKTAVRGSAESLSMQR